jgi:hypothetical protein
MLVCNVHVCGLVACLLSLPSPPTPLRRIQPVLFWRERWHPLIRTALLSLFSNDSGLKTAMLCPLSPIYRYMQSNIIFFAHSLSSYGCVCNRNKLFYCLLFTVIAKKYLQWAYGECRDEWMIVCTVLKEWHHATIPLKKDITQLGVKPSTLLV